MKSAIRLSPLAKTWIVDIDGTIFRHNSHLTGTDQLLPGVLDFFAAIPAQDFILLLTGREARYEAVTLAALKHHGIRYDKVLFEMPKGERILLNDTKPSGLETAFAINVARDAGLEGMASSFLIVDK